MQMHATASGSELLGISIGSISGSNRGGGGAQVGVSLKYCAWTCRLLAVLSAAAMQCRSNKAYNQDCV